MFDSNKVLVHINDSTVLVEKCKEGCPTPDLFVAISIIHSPVMVCVGCAFCGKKVHRAKIGSALNAWTAFQQSTRP